MTLKTIAFLRAVLPDAGLYASWTNVDGVRSYNNVFRDIESLASHILAEDGRGKTVYHACSSFANERGIWNARKGKLQFRCQANVHGVRSLWMDIDAGPDAVAKRKGYPDALAVATAAAQFCNAVSIPPPLVVASGSGLHLYWPLDQTLCTDDWFLLAEGLKHAAQSQGLLLDPARTSDAASVLRTPGSHNRKHGCVAVDCGPLVGPYDPASFDHLVAISAAASWSVRVPTVQTSQSNRITQGLLAYDGPEHYASEIADHCAHVAALRDTQGNLPEPLWYAALGVLAWCADGDELAHHWSSGHPRYNPDETSGKLERARQLTGATTCHKFESLDHGKCAACPHRGKIKSPVSLGGVAHPYAIRMPVLNTTLPTTTSAFLPEVADTSEFFGAPLPPLFAPYKWSKRNQLVLELEKDERTLDVLVSEYPIYLEGVQVGELNKQRFSYHFRQYLPQHGWIDIHIDAEQMTGMSGISKLFGRGAVIHDPKAFMKYVETAVDVFNAQRKLRMRYEQFGWKDDDRAFLLGENLYHAEGVEAVIGTDEVRTRAQFLAPAQGGSLDEWSHAANALFQLGCEGQSFALLCSFASLLTKFHSSNEGGAIVNLVSGKSGTGKTTTLAGVSSVWGSSKALSLTNIDTAVAKGLTLGVLGNLPVIYDELWDRDPMVIRDFVLMFTNGRDKQRGTREGEIKHTRASWQTLLVSAANLSLVELLNSTSAIDAPGMRVLEFPLVLPGYIQHAKGDRLRKALEANCGYAGDAFLRYLLQPEVNAWARQALTQWTDEIWAKTKLRSEHRFWVRTLGSVAVAAALVTQLGILSFQSSRIVDWAMDAMTGQKDDTQISGKTSASADALMRYLGEHLNDTLVMPDRHKQGERRSVLPLLKPTRRLYIRYELAPGRLFVLEHPFRKWLIQNGVNARELLRDLSEQHVILSSRRHVTLGAGTEFPGGQAPCIEINALHPVLGGAIAEIQSLQAVRQPQEQQA